MGHSGKGDQNSPRSRSVFVSYSHRDREAVDLLVTHLLVAGFAGLIDVLHDRRLTPGGKWQPQLREFITNSKIAIPVISADYLTSKFSLEEEIPEMLFQEAEGDLLILPVLLRPCRWQVHPWIQEHQIFTTEDGKALLIDPESYEVHLDRLTKTVLDLLGVGPDEDPDPVSPAPLSIGIQFSGTSKPGVRGVRGRPSRPRGSKGMAIWVTPFVGGLPLVPGETLQLRQVELRAAVARLDVELIPLHVFETATISARNTFTHEAGGRVTDAVAEAWMVLARPAESHKREGVLVAPADDGVALLGREPLKAGRLHWGQLGAAQTPTSHLKLHTTLGWPYIFEATSSKELNYWRGPLNAFEGAAIRHEFANRGVLDTRAVPPLDPVVPAQSTACRPEDLASTLEGGGLTYGDLSARANRLAHALYRLRVRPDSPVGLFPESLLDMPVAVLGHWQLHYIEHGRSMKVDQTSTMQPKGNVYLVSSVAGGTGAGTILDLASLLAKRLGFAQPADSSGYSRSEFVRYFYEALLGPTRRDRLEVLMTSVATGAARLEAEHILFARQADPEGLSDIKIAMYNDAKRLGVPELERHLVNLWDVRDYETVSKGYEFAHDTHVLVTGGATRDLVPPAQTGEGALAAVLRKLSNDSMDDVEKIRLVVLNACRRGGLPEHQPCAFHPRGLYDLLRVSILFRDLELGTTAACQSIPELFVYDSGNDGTFFPLKVADNKAWEMVADGPASVIEKISGAGVPNVAPRERVLIGGAMAIRLEEGAGGNTNGYGYDAFLSACGQEHRPGGGGRYRSIFDLCSPDKLDFRWVLCDQITKGIPFFTGNAVVDNGFEREILRLTQVSKEMPVVGETDETEPFGPMLVTPESLYGARVELLPF